MNNAKSKTQRVNELARLEDVIKALRGHGFSAVRKGTVATRTMLAMHAVKNDKFAQGKKMRIC